MKLIQNTEYSKKSYPTTKKGDIHGHINLTTLANVMLQMLLSTSLPLVIRTLMRMCTKL